MCQQCLLHAVDRVQAPPPEEKKAEPSTPYKDVAAAIVMFLYVTVGFGGFFVLVACFGLFQDDQNPVMSKVCAVWVGLQYVLFQTVAIVGLYNALKDAYKHWKVSRAHG